MVYQLDRCVTDEIDFYVSRSEQEERPLKDIINEARVICLNGGGKELGLQAAEILLAYTNFTEILAIWALNHGKQIPRRIIFSAESIEGLDGQKYHPEIVYTRTNYGIWTIRYKPSKPLSSTVDMDEIYVLHETAVIYLKKPQHWII